MQHDKEKEWEKLRERHKEEEKQLAEKLKALAEKEWEKLRERHKKHQDGQPCGGRGSAVDDIRRSRKHAEHGAAAATSSVSAAAHAPSSSGSATPGSNPKTGSPADQLPKPAPAEEGDKQTSSVKDSTPPSSNTVDTLKASGKDQDEAAAGAGDSETEFSSLTSTAG